MESLLDALLAPHGPRVPPQRKTAEEYARYGYATADAALATMAVPLTEIAGKRILEIGCGFGGVTQRLHELQADVVGVDLNRERIDVARRRFPDAAFDVANSARLPFEDEQFDLIVAHDVLEHLIDLRAALREWQRVLVPGGSAFAATVHWRSRLGSHAYDYITLPWAHLYLPNRLLASYWLGKRRAGAAAGEVPPPERDGRRLEDVFLLNRLTVALLRDAAKQAGLELSELSLHIGSRKLAPALHVPILREVAADHITLRLERPD
jgi:2-polyprenyl-3-methyl-5-hydroxy-6-metoxy-1,4-benzoquinol methylase